MHLMARRVLRGGRIDVADIHLAKNNNLLPPLNQHVIAATDPEAEQGGQKVAIFPNVIGRLPPQNRRSGMPTSPRSKPPTGSWKNDIWVLVSPVW